MHKDGTPSGGAGLGTSFPFGGDKSAAARRDSHLVVHVGRRDEYRIGLVSLRSTRRPISPVGPLLVPEMLRAFALGYL
jgi:hypothetical protein